MEIVKIWSKRILIGIVLVAAFIFIFTRFSGCDNKITVDKNDYYHLYKKMREDSIKSLLNDKKYSALEVKLKTYERRDDSLVALAINIQKKADKSAKTVRELIKKGVCDTVEVLIALNDCDSVKKADNRAMASKDSTNQVLRDENEVLKEDNVLQKGMVASARIILKNQADDYKELEKQSKKQLRRQKFKTVVVIIGGVVIEALTIFALKG